MQTGWISGPWKPTNPVVTFTPAFHSLTPLILLAVAPLHGTVVAVLPVRHAMLLPVKNCPGRLTWVWLMATLNWPNLKTSGITTGIVIGSHPQRARNNGSAAFTPLQPKKTQLKLTTETQ